MRRLSLLVACCGVLIAVEGTARPAMIVGGGGLLTASGADQLEDWLGDGSQTFTFTNIYTKQTGDTSLDFHAAVDGQGPTITVIEILPGLADEHWNSGDVFFSDLVPIPHQIIGGYNPQSWRSFPVGYNLSAPDERDAFLFNLTTIEKQGQLPFDSPDYGQYQTYNGGGYGPTFGGGHDIYIDYYLSGGTAQNVSYGSSFVDSIVDSPNDGYYVDFSYGIAGAARVGQIEVYTIERSSVSTVPEPSSILLFGLGFVGLAGIAVRRRAKPTAEA